MAFAFLDSGSEVPTGRTEKPYGRSEPQPARSMGAPASALEVCCVQENCMFGCVGRLKPRGHFSGMQRIAVFDPHPLRRSSLQDNQPHPGLGGRANSAPGPGKSSGSSAVPNSAAARHDGRGPRRRARRESLRDLHRRRRRLQRRPRIVPNARKLHAVSYDEMLELAASGAKVLQLTLGRGRAKLRRQAACSLDVQRRRRHLGHRGRRADA